MYPYGSIGKINLIPALRLASNLSSEIDRKASGCLSCPRYAAMIRGEEIADKCSSCDHKKNVYQNEKARFGYKEALTKSELFCFLALHLHGPSSTGIVDDISASELAEECLVAPKTIYENLRGLVTKGYIHLNTDIRGSYTVLINGYDQYFAPAREGGRGYIVITRDIFDQLLSIRGNINAVRYALRSYINIEFDSKASYSHELIHTETIRQALSYLPGYLRPCHLKTIVTDLLPNMLSLIKDVGKNIVIRLRPEYYGQTAKQSILDGHIEYFSEKLDAVLAALHDKEKGLISVARMTEHASTAHVSLVHLKAETKNLLLRPEDIVKTDPKSLLSLAQIAVDYGRERVWEAMKQVWHDWRPGRTDQAAYIRTLLAGNQALA